MKLGEVKINQAIQRMKETGKIDASVGGKEVGRIIDFHNSLVKDKKEKNFNKEITARNKYFWPLWKRAIEEMISGVRPASNVYKLKPKKIFFEGGEKKT
jgi:hypothetical protein